jgi:hypothetical protein
MGSTQRFILLVIAGLSAATLPALAWLVLHQDGPPGGQEEEPASEGPRRTVADVLEQRNQSRTVERTDLTVAVTGATLLKIERLTRAPGEGAVAEGMTLDLATLWTTRRGQLGREIDDLWSRLPEDCDTIRGPATVAVGLDGPGGVPLVMAAAPVTLTRGAGGLGIQVFHELAGGASVVLDLERVARTGNVHLTATAGGPWSVAPSWLPKGWSLRFGRLDLMGNAGLVLQGLHVLGGDGEEVFRADKITVEAEGNVPAALLRDGMPGRSVGAERGLSVKAEGLALRWPEALDLPLLEELRPLAGAGTGWLSAASLVRGTNVPLALEGVALERGGRTVARVAALDVIEGPALALRDVALNAGILGISAEGPEVRVGVDPYGVVEWRLTGLSAHIKPGPADLMRITVWGSGVVARLKSLLKRPGEEEAPTPAPRSVGDLLPDTRPLRDLLDNQRVFCEGCALSLAAGPVDLAFKGVKMTATWEHASELSLRFEAGGVEGTDDLSGPFVLSADLDSEGRPAKLGARLGGEKISALLRRAVPAHALREGAMELDISWTRSERGAIFGGWLRGTDLLIEHRWIAGWPVRIPALRVAVEGLWDEKADRLELSVSRAEIGQVWGRGSLNVGRVSGVRTYELTLDFPEQDCGKLFRAIPRELVPHLSDAVFQGSLWFRGAFSVDLEDVRKTIKVDLSGDWERCRAVTLGPNVNVDALNREDFVHRVVVKGEDLGIVVGPGTGDFTELYRIPKYVQAAAWGTEDLAFFKHKGFKLSLIRRALILLFERGYFAYGGSTVSQQLVKNLFLYRAKTASRKLEEAVITWHMERTLSKERILELYLNCIEFGPKIWGIKRAARTYFGKRPEELSPLEGAFIMANKPDPPYGYYMYRRGQVNDRWKKKLKRVMDRLHFQMGVISAAQYAAESHLEPRFRVVGGEKPGEEVPPPEGEPLPDADELPDEPPAAMDGETVNL